MDAICQRRLPADAAHGYAKAAFEADISDAARAVACPTLVLHARQDGHTPFEEGAGLAALIAGARFVPVDSANHLVLDTEPCWPAVCAEISAFLGHVRHGPTSTAPSLTPRQAMVLRLVSRGKTDKQIARELELSPRTVEMHVAGAMKALDCTTRAEAVHRAGSSGLLPD